MRVLRLLSPLLLLVIAFSVPPAAAAGPADQSFLVYPGSDKAFSFVMDRPGYVTLVVTVQVGAATLLHTQVDNACLSDNQVMPSASPVTLRINCGHLYLHSYAGSLSATGAVDGVLHVAIGTVAGASP